LEDIKKKYAKPIKTDLKPPVNADLQIKGNKIDDFVIIDAKKYVIEKNPGPEDEDLPL
jgi:hypothetical protein